MTRAALIDLLAYSTWANRRVLAALQANPVPAAVRLFGHLLLTEQIYLARLRGQDPWPQDFWQPMPLAACAEAVAANAVALPAFLATHTDASLQQPVRYRNSAGTYFETPPAAMLTHLALHGAYHRGQIATLLRAAGYDPVNTDYIAWARAAPGARGSSRIM